MNLYFKLLILVTFLLFVFGVAASYLVSAKDPAEGSPNDESITFQTVEGMEVGADVGISYHIDPKKVSNIFQKYRKGITEITDIYLRNMVRGTFVAEASQLEVESVYGKGKNNLLMSVESRVKAKGDADAVRVKELQQKQNVLTCLVKHCEKTQK